MTSTIIIMSSLLLTLGILSIPTQLPAFSQQEPSSVIITLGAADEGNFEPFTPRALNVMPGNMVSWTNEDSTTHTVTADGGSGVPLFDSGPIPPGGIWDNIYDSPGTFSYHCAIHPWMTGRIMVG